MERIVLKEEMDPEAAAKMESLKELMEFAKLLQGEDLQGRYGAQPGVDESGYPEGMAENVPGARTEQEEEQLEQEGVGGGAEEEMAEGESPEFSLDRLKMALARAK